MTPLIVSGFEPFGGARSNPSGEAALALHGSSVGGHRVHGLQLPCRFDGPAGMLQALIKRERPALVLALGLAPSRRGFSLERVAVNWVDARIADNAGAQPVDEAVLAGAPAAYFATLPLKAMAAALCEAGCVAELSMSAGSYVCNQLFYLLLHGLRDSGAAPRAGFMHVGADLDAAQVAAGVRVALQAALTHRGPDRGPARGSIDGCR